MLRGTQITLRAPLDKDEPLLLDIRNDFPLQSLLMSMPRGNTLKKLEDWLVRNTNDPHMFFYVIADNQSDSICGYIQLANIDFTHGIGELGICLSNSHQKKGFGTEAIYLLERYASETFRIRKFTLKVIAFNSAHLFYQKIGYYLAGTLKEHFYYQRAFHDVFLMEKFLISNNK